AKYFSTLRMWGIMSADDILEKLNMNPLPQGRGSTYLVPLNMQPAPAVNSEGRSERRSAAVRRQLGESFRRVFADAAARIVRREEAEIMREEIRLIDIELGNIDKAAEGTMHRAEETTSVAPAVAAYIPPTGTSVKKLKIPQSVTDPQALLKAVYEKKVSINVIKWHLPAIKQELNSGRDVPGVYFTEETKVPQRAGRIK
ncbi:hypothetical protein LCGC14_1355260, partial [marine sediment metagenome]